MHQFTIRNRVVFSQGMGNDSHCLLARPLPFVAFAVNGSALAWCSHQVSCAHHSICGQYGDAGTNRRRYGAHISHGVIRYLIPEPESVLAVPGPLYVPAIDRLAPPVNFIQPLRYVNASVTLLYDPGIQWRCVLLYRHHESRI